MSDLSPRRGSGLSRRQREDRAYQLVVAGGIAGLVAAIGIALAIVGLVGSWLPILALIVAAICGLLFRRTVTN
jgi:fatty acid desaturase